MTRRLLLLLALLGPPSLAPGQVSLSADYAWLRAAQWDDVIRAYNFYRPWQEDPLPFLTSGVSARLGWYVALDRGASLYLHPEAGISRWSASSENPGTRMKVRVDAYSVQANFNFNPRTFFRRVYAGPLGTRWMFQISPGLQLWSARVETQDGPWLWDETTGEEYAPRSLSFFLAAGMGYRAGIILRRWVVTPRLSIRLSPAAELEDFPLAVNGANLTGLRAEARPVLMWTAGVECTGIFTRKFLP